MILGIEKEAAVFLVAFLDGIMIVLAYNAIRIFRRIIVHNVFWVSLEDILFWILAAIYIFTEMVRVCSGSIRWYFVLGIFLGAVSICVAGQKLLKKYIDKPKKKR